MIKRISFGEPAAAPATLPGAVRPLRVAVCTELSGDTVSTLEWFTDERRLTLFEDRLSCGRVRNGSRESKPIRSYSPSPGSFP